MRHLFEQGLTNTNESNDNSNKLPHQQRSHQRDGPGRSVEIRPPQSFQTQFHQSYSDNTSLHSNRDNRKNFVWGNPRRLHFEGHNVKKQFHQQNKSKFQQRPSTSQYPPKQFNSFVPSFQQQKQANYPKWPVKRPHDLVELSPFASSSRGETSPVAKRQLHKQSSLELPANEMLAPATPQQLKKLQKKKQNQNSPAKLNQNIKEEQWKEVLMKTLGLLENCKQGTEVAVLLERLQPSNSSWNNIKDQIYRDMLNLMKPLGVDKVLVFGSTLTGLDFMGSDLDYHIALKNPPVGDENIKELLTRALKLARATYNFRIVFSVMQARVPIIRLAHYQSNVICDVNFTSPYGYYNSQFIGTVLSFDIRIKELAVVLKLWSKSLKIAEKMVMSNYCLIMLLIFYLQNLPTPMLDTIKNNQANSQTQILDQNYRWNFFFNDRINKSNENTQSTRELLEGFFEFYHKINFGIYTVCLFNGDLIERKNFEEHPDLQFYREIVAQHELPSIKLDNPDTFIIQDGFEQNLNIGIKSKKHCDTFFTVIKLSYELCMEYKSATMSTLLVKLLSEVKFQEPETKSETKMKKKFQMTIHSIAGDLKVRNL